MRLAVVNLEDKNDQFSAALSIARSLVKENESVLLVDLDPQAYITRTLNIVDPEKTINDVLSWEAKLEDTFMEAEGLTIVPADIQLSLLNISLAWSDQREIYLKTALDMLSENFDHIIIDCPGSLSFLTINSLYACDMAIIPTVRNSWNKDHMNEVELMSLNACEELVGTKVVSMDNSSNILNDLSSHFINNNKVVILNNADKETLEEVPVYSNRTSSHNYSKMAVMQEIKNYTIHLN
ncbi:AAA family ATPase [Fulvivirga sp. M361]|uniref:ParA family protein n=1 Tax=Fulvivirga sp. M361 TaxID=2594266 RepID=UPI001179ACFB|nr:AAA family ATPase [Fulvivirga sp. M361]TRX59090.1 AAA family ATPase [Fulvivirga sp. M361]